MRSFRFGGPVRLGTPHTPKPPLIQRHSSIKVKIHLNTCLISRFLHRPITVSLNHTNHPNFFHLSSLTPTFPLPSTYMISLRCKGLVNCYQVSINYYYKSIYVVCIWPGVRYVTKISIWKKWTANNGWLKEITGKT